MEDPLDPDWSVIAEEVGYSLEALEFLFDALQFAPQYRGQEPTEIAQQEHSSAQQLCTTVLDYARDCYGDAYKEVLRSEGLKSSEDLGRLVFALVRMGRIEALESDNPSDFKDLYDLGGDSA